MAKYCLTCGDETDSPLTDDAGDPVCPTCATEKGLLVNIPAEDPNLNLKSLLDIIAGRAPYSAQAQRAVDVALNGYEAQMATVLVAAARARVDRLYNVLNGLSAVEDRLLDSTTIANMTPSQLLATYRAVQTTFVADTAFVERVIELRSRIAALAASGGKHVDIGVGTLDVDDGIMSGLPPASRERLRLFVDYLTTQAGDARRTLDGPPE